MCDKIIINGGDKEIETPAQFVEHFGFLPIKDVTYLDTLDMESCLCQCDIEGTFESKNIAYKKDCGEFYVGELIYNLVEISKELAFEKFPNRTIYYKKPNDTNLYFRCWWHIVNNHFHEFPKGENYKYFIKNE